MLLVLKLKCKNVNLFDRKWLIYVSLVIFEVVFVFFLIFLKFVLIYLMKFLVFCVFLKINIGVCCIVLLMIVVVMLLFMLSSFMFWLYDVISVFLVVVNGMINFFCVCFLFIFNGFVILIGICVMLIKCLIFFLSVCGLIEYLFM